VVNAIVLLKVRRNQIVDVAEALREIVGVTEVYTVAGQYDLVALIRARDDEAFAAIVTEGMLRVEGIVASETLISFKVYSEYDLDEIFAPG
jgi:DNA-binding Lrp family transcriptional regulator